MLTLGSMFSGVGLLDYGLLRANPDWELAWQFEVDRQASKVLGWRWPGIPNHGDVTQVDWSEVEPVDVLCGGGFPCQPFSSAGQRRGMDDERFLWPEVVRAVGVLRPQLLLLENVADLVAPRWADVFGRILADLASLGFDAKWTCLRASDVGAPHRRKRWFLAAYRSRTGRGNSRQPDGCAIERRQLPAGSDARRCGPAAADPSGPAGWQVARSPSGDEGEHGGGGPDATNLFGGCGEAPADLYCTGRERARPTEPAGSAVARWGSYAPAIERWERVTGECAPDPLDGRGRLNVELVRWMMGAPRGWHDHPHGGLSRSAAIRGYGNGVVVQVAEVVGRWAADGLA